MTRNATASWSGYSHQGKVGILIALKKINELQTRGLCLNGNLINYESTEDVALIDTTGTVTDVHQVKALIGGRLKSDYTEALAVFVTGTGVNYLHTICHVDNWSNSSVANPQNVELYPYQLNVFHCDLNDIYRYVDQQLEILLAAAAHPQSSNTDYRRQIYQQYLDLIDEKIRYEHRNKVNGNFDITFTLQQFHEIAINNPMKDRMVTFAIRQQIFIEYEKFMRDLFDQNYIVSPEQEIEVAKVFRSIYELPDNDFKKFLMNISPHTNISGDDLSAVLTDAYFHSDSFYGMFIDCIVRIVNSKCEITGRSIAKYQKGKSYLLTSIVGTSGSIKRHATSILSNPHINFSGYDTDFLITSCYSGTLEQNHSTLIESDPVNFNVPKNICFIPSEEAIKKLNE